MKQFRQSNKLITISWKNQENQWKCLKERYRKKSLKSSLAREKERKKDNKN